MMNVNLSDVQESGEFLQVEPGQYVGKVVRWEDEPTPESGKGARVVVYLDFADGQYKDRATNYEAQTGKTTMYFKKYLVYSNQNALGMIKKFLADVAVSNPALGINKNAFNPVTLNKLLGAKIGMNITTREYKDSEEKTRTAPQLNKTIPISEVTANSSMGVQTSFSGTVVNNADVPF